LIEQDLKLIWAAHLDAEARRAIGRIAREHGVADSVRLTGYVSDAELSALYRGAVAQLFVSRAEGFGYPAVEAMAAGCPVITSDRSSMAEIAGDAALLVDPESSDAIADAIITLASSSEARQSYAQRGVQRAARFSLERMASDTLAVYRNVLANSRA
jgi:glycosyltransferase involved in cell wall biosynthesis